MARRGIRFSDGPCAGAALGVLAGLAAPAEAASPSPSPPPRPPAAIYAKVCGYCHGQHVGPVIRRLPPDHVIQMVRNGPRAMPAFRPTEISDAELKALAQWVHDSHADPKEHDE